MPARRGSRGRSQSRSPSRSQSRSQSRSPAPARSPKPTPTAPSRSAASRLSPGLSQAAQNTRAETQRNLQEGLRTVGGTLSLAEAQLQARLRGVSVGRVAEEARNQGLNIGSRLQNQTVRNLLSGTQYGRTIGTSDVRNIAQRTGASRQEVLSAAGQLDSRLGSTARRQATRLAERRRQTRATNRSANQAGVSNVGGTQLVQLPDSSTFQSLFADVLSGRQALEADIRNAEANQSLATLETESRERIAETNLQGVRSQSDAARIAAEQSAGATRFAATEGTRGQIETQRIASGSEERRIGLTGQETRETELQREMFRRYEEQRNYDQARAAFRA